MRRRHVFTVLGVAPLFRGVGALLATVLAAACTGDEFLVGDDATSSNGVSVGGGESGSGQTTGGDGGAGASSGDGGASSQGGGGAVGDCDPAVSGSNPIPEECGVFVDPNLPPGTLGSGTRADPFRSIVPALERVAEGGEPRIYVQAGTATGALILEAEGLELHGGLTDEWTYEPLGRTTIRQNPSSVAPVATVRVEPNAVETLMSNFDVRGRETTRPGESSVGIFTLRATLRLRRTTVEAFDAADGAHGETPADDIGDGDPALDGTMNSLGGSTQPGEGSEGGVNSRVGCANSGGDGGDGAAKGDYYEADPGTLGSPPGGEPGKGATRAELTGNAVACDHGGNGTNGAPGSDGGGAVGPGRLSASTGYLGPVGQEGTRGKPGKPGGGGGGGAPTALVAGDGGNGAGAGGCGGLPALSAQSGGSSIAIVAIGGALIFDDDVVLRAGDGGDGGNGAAGQSGAGGGVGWASPGNVNWSACRGGNGGRGGRGGNGGAGAGGHSLGIAFAEETELLGDVTTTLASEGAPGQPGGSGVDAADAGVSAPSRELPLEE